MTGTPSFDALQAGDVLAAHLRDYADKLEDELGAWAASFSRLSGRLSPISPAAAVVRWILERGIAAVAVIVVVSRFDRG